ncbi:MAG: hydroxylamine reductase [candidate division WOR-3 bacterium]
MFCYQCEQTANGKGCTSFGVCGKDPQTSNLQDMLVYLTEGISVYASKINKFGKTERAIDRFILEAFFTTVTNVNFDPEKVFDMIKKGEELREKAKNLYEKILLEKKLDKEDLPENATFMVEKDYEKVLKQSENFTFDKEVKKYGDDIAGLRHLVIYGLKGTAAYADHAMILGVEDDDVYKFFHDALNRLAMGERDKNNLVSLALKVGEINFKVMEMLDKANTSAYGNPVPTKVRVTPIKGKSIVVSGHDLKDLYLLLQQTEGKGINIYTHGEMLPAHGYPELKKFKHLVGNYGSAWQNQREEFDQFKGAILMTTNCIQKPKDTYKNRIFTTGLVQWPDVEHIGEDKDFSPVIKAALENEGFESDGDEKYITVGFGHNAVLGVTDKVIDLVKQGKIKKFVLIGGCDGAKPGRNYYTDFATKLPKDTIILTLACGKYRFNKFNFGDIEGIPRLLDIGQCNDAYSAIKIALELSKAFDLQLNDLPLSLVLSWYEQKAVCILLTLLHLGIKNIKLGPSMPAFVKPNVYQVIKDNFNLVPIKSVEEDIKEILSH